MRSVVPVVPGHNLPVTEIARNQPEYETLLAYRDEDGMVITRWRLSIRERLKILFSGSMWLYILTFNHPLQPILPTVEKPEVKS